VTRPQRKREPFCNTVSLTGSTKAYSHLAPLCDLADTLRVTEYALQNAKRLAIGYDDLVVILLEPSDAAEDVKYEEIFNYSEVFKEVDKSLRFAFKNRRSLKDTIWGDDGGHFCVLKNSIEHSTVKVASFTSDV